MAGARELTRRQKLAAVTDEILRLKGDVAKGVYQIGRLLDGLLGSEQWRDGGHPRFSDYLREETDMSVRVAKRFIRVARNFNAAIAERYGVTKLDAALKYLGATPASEKPGDLLATEIRVRGPDGRYQVLTLHEATTLQIEEATEALAPFRRTLPRDELEALRDELRQAADRLTKLFALEP